MTYEIGYIQFGEYSAPIIEMWFTAGVLHIAAYHQGYHPEYNGPVTVWGRDGKGICQMDGLNIKRAPHNWSISIITVDLTIDTVVGVSE